MNKKKKANVMNKVSFLCSTSNTYLHKISLKIGCKKAISRRERIKKNRIWLLNNSRNREQQSFGSVWKCHPPKKKRGKIVLINIVLILKSDDIVKIIVELNSCWLLLKDVFGCKQKPGNFLRFATFYDFYVLYLFLFKQLFIVFNFCSIWLCSVTLFLNFLYIFYSAIFISFPLLSTTTKLPNTFFWLLYNDFSKRKKEKERRKKIMLHGLHIN